ncbi:hypothetical protein EON82_15050, partial [bacterium]
MERRCREHEEGLATLAEGGSAPEAEAHVASCAACASRLAELRKTVESARLPFFDAPAELVARAQALMAPAVRRRWVARLLGNGLAASGARGAVKEEFALHVGTDEHSVRLQFIPTRTGWEMAGRAPAEGWQVVHGDVEMVCGPSGRFRLAVPSLDDSGFLLRSPESEIEVP